MRNRNRAALVSRAALRLERSARFVVEGLEGRLLLSAGDPDATFGTGGKLLLSDGTPSEYRLVMTSAVQADGKILLAGSVGADQLHLNTFFLERLNSDGTPDAGFGTGGVVTASFGTGVAQGKSIMIQSDGSIVLGGTYRPDSTGAAAEFAIARFTSTGAPDATFGTGGKVLTRIPGSEQLGTILLAPGNKIVAVGSGTYQDPVHPTDAAYSAGVVDVARYNSDGTPDTAFNGTGYAYLQSGQLSGLAAVGAVQSDGKILVGGNYGFNPVVYRFNLDGTLDTSFGLSGRAMLVMPYYSLDSYQSATIYKMVVQPNGQILLAGKGFDEGHNRYSALLARFNSDGWVDTSFGDDGLVIPPDTILGANYQAIGGLSVQTDGKIVLEGTAPEFGNYGGLWAARYLPNGSADPTFHSNEVAYYPFGFNQFGGVGAAMSPNGSIIIAGNVSDTLTQSGILLTRLQNDGAPAASASLLPYQTMNDPSGSLPGQLDASFGVLGKTEFNNPSPVKLPDRTTFTVNATTVLASGKILIAGSTGMVANNGQGQFFLRRLNADGTVDATFGTNGSVVTAVGNYSWATSILVQTDGKIILGGASVDALPSITNANFALARYDANGALDTTFGAAGKEITDFPGNEQVDSLAFGPGGTIVAAGSFFLYPNVGFDVARYTGGGLPDTSFNSTGMLQKSLGQTGSNSRATAVAVQSDGKVVVGSHSGNDYAVYRFNSGGSVDGGFGNAGMSTVNAAFPPNYVLPPGTMTKLVIQPDGKIIAAGQTTSVYDYRNHVLARFDVDGSLDNAFGTNGAVVISSNVPTSFQQKDVYSLAALILQADGEVLLVGNDRSPFGSDLGSPAGAPMVRKFLSDGTPDPYFTVDQDPWFLPPPPFYPGAPITGVALTPDGRLIVVANVTDGLRWGGVARYLNDAHTITVSNLNDSGPGSLRAALDQAATSLPSSAIRFSPGLNGSINLATPIVESGSADNPVWIFGPGALNLSIHGNISVAGPVSVSGLTLFNGGVASPVSQSYTDSTVHGALPASGSYSILRSSLLGNGTTATALSAGSSGPNELWIEANAPCSSTSGTPPLPWRS